MQSRTQEAQRNCNSIGSQSIRIILPRLIHPDVPSSGTRDWFIWRPTYMKRFRISFQLIPILLCVAIGHAQTAVTSVHGTVLDQSGAALPNAHVSISDPATGFKAERLTDAHGEYAFEQIKPDTYTILVSSQGFSSQRQLAELLVNQARTADFKLAVAAASGETVEVQGDGAAL